MNNNDDGYKDPFADLDDGFGDDNFGMDDGLGNAQANQHFEEEMPLDTSADFDEFGDPIVHDQAQPAYAQEDQTQEQESPAFAPQTAPQSAAKPFIKTPIGMASVGAGVFVLGLVGFVGIKSMGGSGETLTEAAPPGPEPLAPVAGDPNFDSNTQPTQSSAAIVTEPLPARRLPTPAEQLAGAEAAPAQVAAGQEHSPVNAQKLVSSLDEKPVISTPDEVSRLKAALSHQQEETESLKAAFATLTQGVSKLSAYAEKDHDEQVQIKDQLDALVKRLDDAPVAPAAVALPASKAPVTVNVDAAKAPANPVGESANANAPGRYRLPGLKVIEATESGKMAVVTKAANGRTFTLFKGERLGTPRGSMTVTEVKDDGFLIFVGDKYYIDKVSEDKPQAAPVVQAAKVERAEKPAKRVAEAKPVKKALPEADTSAYTLNAVYDGGNSFGIVNSSGDFKSYRTGDDLPGVGKITGLDANGNLKAGSKVIKSLY